MEEDAKDGQGYSLGIHMRDENEDSENRQTKKKARTEEQCNNPLTRLALEVTQKCAERKAVLKYKNKTTRELARELF
jgi:hypothetical protein